MRAKKSDDSDPWTWPTETWRGIVDHVRAGRSLKPSSWKGGATWAMALSFDSDHETVDLRNGGKSISRISQGQYGARAGVPRILKVLDRLSGQTPVGMRTASWDFSPWTLKIIREMGLLYDSSLMADDEPYELLDQGEPTGIVELPVEWIRDDAVYFNMDRATSLRPHGGPQMVFDIFRRELEVAFDEGGLFLLTMHPHHIGHRSRIWILDEIISAAKATGSVWFATHAEIAAYCAAEAGLKRAEQRGAAPRPGGGV